MRTIEECIYELKTRRYWKNVSEVESVFDEILEIDRSRIDNIIQKIKNKITVNDTNLTVVMSLTDIINIIKSV